MPLILRAIADLIHTHLAFYESFSRYLLPLFKKDSTDF